MNNYVTTQYYELKSEDSLPVGAYFTDPYDNAYFQVIPKETLSQFLKRISDHRAANKHPELRTDDLKTMVVTFLVETCPPNKLNSYFVLKAIHPQFSQVVQFAKAIAREKIQNRGIVGTKQQRERALKCLSCPFHQRSGIPPHTSTVLLRGLLGNTVYPEQGQLGVCGMCGCGLKEKVKFQLEGVVRDLKPHQLDTILKAAGTRAFDICWILNEALSNSVILKTLKAKMDSGTANGSGLLQARILEKTKSGKTNDSSSQ